MASRSKQSNKQSSKQSHGSLNAASIDRVRMLINAITKPIHLPILNQIKLETSPRSNDSSNNQSVNQLTSTSSLMKSQARLKQGYVDFADGRSELLDIARADSTNQQTNQSNAQSILPVIVDCLIDRLHVKNSATRLLSMYLIDSLFNKSAKFRSLILDQLQSIYQLTVRLNEPASGLSLNQSNKQTIKQSDLPNPPEFADQLHSETVALINQWHTKYGKAYKLLQLGYQWLIDRLNVADPALDKREAENQRKVAQAKQESLMRAKFVQLQREWNENHSAMDSSINQIDGALDILFPSDESWLAEIESEELAAQLGLVDQTDDVQEDDDVEWEDTESIDAPTSDQSNNQGTLSSSQSNQDHLSVVHSSSPAQSGTLDNHSINQAISSSFDSSLYDDDDNPLVWNDRIAPADEDADDGLVQLDALVKTKPLDIAFDANLGLLEDEGTRVIFESLRDNCMEVQKHWLPMIDDWLHTLRNVRFEPVDETAADVDDARIKLSQLQSQHRSLTKSIQTMSEAMKNRVVQCAQLNIHIQRQATLESQLTAAEAESSKSDLPVKNAVKTITKEFSVDLRERRARAVKQLGKLAPRKRKMGATERASEKASAIHKRNRGDDRIMDR